ncbi:NCS2 family permease [Larsenimonas rhizosphaerae]|uniref:NCS2 family permease n=1 Tax=Larsenimonas rhizosphaerae TaxID=2944682 RepID=A0AA41ZH69_9GAMM|nr:NCS2 family permease [Larsenimonas rhizosphaerae]MCM2132094.1 NCS2 family permease [Larsenimonas rhizosphaerae]MCX2524697.1 NCS2 family permease [Larsenimonas rhizosphaerae]
MLEKLFTIRAQGSTPRQEILAGVATFLAAMYIIVVNPSILSDAGIPFSSALTATVIISFFGSLMMGLYARNPILVAPGMGINALFTYTMVLGAGIPWATALGCVFWAGVLFAVLALFNVRQYVIDAIPSQLRYAIACGIGLFITTIGLVNAGFLTTSPATVVTMAPMDAPLVTFLIGMALTAVLVARRVQGALILGIIFTTLLAWPIGRWWGDGSAYLGTPTLVNFSGIFAWPDFSGLMQVDIMGALDVAYAPFIFVILFTIFFDALSTFMGVCQAGKLLDKNGEPRNIRQSMVIDALSALISAPLGTSPANAYVESAAGISQGGRTGLVAVVAALLFLPFLFLSPLLSLVPAIATAPALIMVGVFMLDPIRMINWYEMDDAIPAFIAMILIPLTYSITHGVVFGFLSFVVVKVGVGKAREVKPAMWVLFVLSILLLMEG